MELKQEMLAGAQRRAILCRSDSSSHHFRESQSFGNSIHKYQ